VRHAILGAGGVGGLIGAALAHQGDQVTLLLRPETLGQHPSYLRLQGPFGNFQAPVRTDAKLREPIDVLWVTVKAYQLVAALRAVPRNGPRIVTVVPLLNGIDHVALLRRSFNHESVVPGTIAVESERVAPGHIIHVHRLSAWRFPRLGSGRWKVLPDGFGTRAFLVNFKRMKKQCSGANLRSWRHSRSQLQRVTRASRRSSPTLYGGHDSN
jgi:ketopantoate reductase